MKKKRRNAGAAAAAPAATPDASASPRVRRRELTEDEKREEARRRAFSLTKWELAILTMVRKSINTLFWGAFSMLNMISLPRQAQDEDRKS